MNRKFNLKLLKNYAAAGHQTGLHQGQFVCVWWHNRAQTTKKGSGQAWWLSFKMIFFGSANMLGFWQSVAFHYRNHWCGLPETCLNILEYGIDWGGLNTKKNQTCRSYWMTGSVDGFGFEWGLYREGSS